MKSMSSRFQQGVSLIEVLVATLVLSIGVLGYAGLQLRALNSTEDAHYRTQAVAIAQDIVERIRANPIDPTMTDQVTTLQDERSMVLLYYGQVGNWPQGVLNNAVPANWDQCMLNACTPLQVAAWDVEQVRWLAWNLLPQGRVQAQPCTVAGNLCITIAWNEVTPATCDVTQGDCIIMEVTP